MTEDEKRQQKAMLLLEYHETEQTLCHLEKKASDISKRLSVMSEWLGDASKRNELLREVIFYSPKFQGEAKPLADPQFREAMNFEAAAQLFNEIKTTRARLDELQKQKQSLGLK